MRRARSCCGLCGLRLRRRCRSAERRTSASPGWGTAATWTRAEPAVAGAGGAIAGAGEGRVVRAAALADGLADGSVVDATGVNATVFDVGAVGAVAAVGEEGAGSVSGSAEGGAGAAAVSGLGAAGGVPGDGLGAFEGKRDAPPGAAGARGTECPAQE